MVEPAAKEITEENTVTVKAGDKDIIEESEKIDSGMDDGSNSGSVEAGDNSEDEDVVARKPKKSMQRIFDDDDDESEDVSQDVPSRTETIKKQEFNTAEEVLEAVMNDSSDEESESENNRNISSAKKKKVVKAVSDDSSDDGENETLLETIKKTAVKNGTEDIFDTEETSRHEGIEPYDNVPLEEKAGKVPDNLFDNEDSDSSGSSSSSGSNSDKSDSEKGGDEGFDESSIDPKLLAKLKKGAAKKPPRERSKRIKKDDVTSIHSETQRMVRESRVNLPYHQPAPKSLNDFLARANKKQQDYKVLKGCRQSLAKAKILQDILEKSRIQSKPKSQEELGKYSDSDEDWDPNADKEKTLKERLEEKQLKSDSPQVGADIAENAVEKKDSGDVVNDKVNVNETVDDNDSLPDINELQTDKIKSLSQDLAETKCLSQDLAEDTNSADVLVDTVNIALEESSSKQLSNSADGVNSENVAEDKCENAADDDVLFDWEKCDKDTDDSKMDTEDASKDTNSVVNAKDIENCTENSENIDPHIHNSKEITDISSPKVKTSPNSASKKKSKKKLAALAGIDLDNVKPCLSGQLDTFISLEEEEEIPKHPGLLKLMDRLCKHSAKPEKKHAKDMDISIISKDKTGFDKEELKLNTFTYHVEEEESNPLSQLETPGAKLVALKEQLQEKIRAKRELARQKRQEEMQMYNDEGGFDEEKEEEEEMSEHSDTDVEDDNEFEKQFGDDEEEIEDDEEEEKETNPFADDEAAEDDDEAVERDDDADDEDEDDMNLKLDVSDDEQEDEQGDEEEEEEDEKEILPAKKKNANTSEVSDDESEDKADQVEFKEPFKKKVPEKPFSMFGSRQNSLLTETQFPSGQKSSGLTMVIEDSQDLYGATVPDIVHTQGPPTQPSQDFTFFLEDSQSNMLDADGYLKTKTTVKKSTPPSLGVDDFPATQGGNMDELLGLCSGRFAGTQAEGKDKSSRKSLFDETAATQGSNMDELMGLCSGMFTDGKATQSEKKQGTKRKVSGDDSDGDSIAALSDNDDRNTDKDDASDNDEVDGDVDEVDGDVDEVDGDVDEGGDTDHIDTDQEEEEQKFTGFTLKNKKHGKIRQEFVEEEAELSGSECDSDENLDIPEEEDIMEMEEGDKDAAQMDEEQLRDEVGRVHLKQLIDEDKRELLRYQEMYLPDGDLHSEGAGRTRKFKWSNMDDDTNQDVFGDGSDAEPETEENDTDFQWRKERFEREQFLKEQQEKENNDGENSQFLKLGKVFLKKQGSVDSSSSTGKEKTNKSDTSVSCDTPGFPGSFYKLSNQKRGSFLARSKEALAKIAEMTKPVVNPSAGAKSGGKFTFQVISPEKGTETTEPPKDGKRKAHVPNQKTMETRNKKPPAKKQKLDSQKSFTNNSIFHHL